MHGRNAAYGPRHLLQLVVIKRRQAEGRTLAQIQAEVVGAPDADLQAIACVPDALLAGAATASDSVPTGERRSVGARFWAAPATTGELTSDGSTRRDGSTRPDGAPRPVGSPWSGGTLTGVPLDADVILLLNTTPDSDDLAAIHVAARPLLHLLAARGLRTRREGARDDDRVHHLDDPS
jgi:hypothetical protein